MWVFLKKYLRESLSLWVWQILETKNTPHDLLPRALWHRLLMFYTMNTQEPPLLFAQLASISYQHTERPTAHFKMFPSHEIMMGQSKHCIGYYLWTWETPFSHSEILYDSNVIAGFILVLLESPAGLFTCCLHDDILPDLGFSTMTKKMKGVN